MMDAAVTPILQFPNTWSHELGHTRGLSDLGPIPACPGCTYGHPLVTPNAWNRTRIMYHAADRESRMYLLSEEAYNYER